MVLLRHGTPGGGERAGHTPFFSILVRIFISCSSHGFGPCFQCGEESGFGAERFKINEQMSFLVDKWTFALEQLVVTKLVLCVLSVQTIKLTLPGFTE